MFKIPALNNNVLFHLVTKPKVAFQQVNLFHHTAASKMTYVVLFVIKLYSTCFDEASLRDRLSE